MKKFALPVAFGSYLISLLLPFTMKMDMNLYESRPVSGFAYMATNTTVTGLLICLLVLTFYFKFRGKNTKFLLFALDLVWLYLYVHFLIMTPFDGSRYLEYVKAVFSFLQIGYFISGSIAAVCSYLLMEECRKESVN